jgi:hypothetical protein
VRRLSKASPAASTFGTGTSRSLFGLVCLCVIGLAAFLGSGVPSAGAAAETCPNAAIRIEQGATSLPDCRAYEQVSPVDKSGNSVLNGGAGTQRAYAGWSSADGDTALYNVGGGPNLVDPARGLNAPQVSERTANGWTSRSAADGPAPQATINTVVSTLIGQVPSADRKSLMFVSGSSFTPDNPYVEGGGELVSSGVNIARGDAVEWISKPTWAGATPQPGRISPGTLAAVGATDDLSTAFFVSLGTLTPEDATSGRVGASSFVAGSSWGLYRWHDGQLTNGGVLPDGTLDPGGSVLAGDAPSEAPIASASNIGPSDMYGFSHSVSPDGSSWLFVSPDPNAHSGRPAQLYLGREGKPSVLLSTEAGQDAPIAASAGVFRVGGRNGSLNAQPSETQAGMYAIRSRDGRYVLFTTSDALTTGAPADATEKTYRYDVDQQTLTYLPDLTFAPSGSPVVNFGPVFNVSDDGSRVLYRDPATGLLGIWRENETPITLSAATGANGVSSASRFSTDGHTLVVASLYPLRGQANHPANQVQIYRYTEADDKLNCVSCPPAGVTPTGNSTFSPVGQFSPNSTESIALYAREATRGVSADGKRIFFSTPTPLTIDDHNSVEDVYEWSEEGLRLLSGGRAGGLPSYIVDNDAGGDNVFFVTAEGLVPQDTDGVYDMYDARVGGGFPPPTPPSLECTGEACQAPPGKAPQASSPLSATAVDPGKVEPKPLAARPTGLDRSVFTVAVSAPGAGKIAANGRGLRPVKRTVKRAATYELKLRLGKRLRQKWKSSRRLTLRAQVRFTPTEGESEARNVKLTISNRKGH